MISAKEFNNLIKGASKDELKELIIAGVNEVIRMSDSQLLKLIELRGE